MTYELARKLKEAGWPQEIKDEDGDNVYCELEYIKEDGEIYSTYAGDDIPKDCYAVPTLEELIEACGDKLRALEHQTLLSEGHENRWFAHDGKENEGFGSTPEKAVANLWRKLNSK